MVDVTSLSAWRCQAEGQPFTLPSGNVAQLRRVHVLELVQRGQIPDTLTGLVAQMIDTANVTLKVSLDDLSRYVEVVNQVCLAAFVSPKLAPEPAEGALGVDEVCFLDRTAVFEWCHISARRLEPFRARPGPAVDAAQPGERVRDAPEPDGGGAG